KRYSVKGVLDAAHQYTGLISRPGNLPLTLSLSLDPSGSGQITGGLSVNGSQIAFVNSETPLTSSTIPEQGRYTMLLPSDSSHVKGVNYRVGGGYATVVISTAGRARVAGVLGDGTPFTVAGPLSADGTFPFFLLPYPNGGIASGILQFANPSDSSTA